MLDNNDINEQLANEAWERMRLLLDAEMPVAEDRRKRPFFWIWSTTVGIAASMLLAGAGTWWIARDVFTTGTNAAVTEEIAPVLPGAIHDLNKVASVSPTSKEDVIQDVNRVTHAPTAPKEGAIRDLSMVTPANPAQARVNNVAGSLANESAVEGIGFSNNIEGAQTTPLTLETSIHTTSDESVLAEVSTSRLPEANLVQLPGLDLTAIAVEENSFSPQAILVGKLPKAWRHGPELGGVTSFPTSLVGFHAGWVAEMPIADGFALRGAMRYDYQRQTVSSSERQLFRESSSMADFMDDPFNPVVGSSVAQPDTIISSTLKMHYAALPLAVSYKLNERWRVEGGVQVAYLLRAFRESKNTNADFAVTGAPNVYNAFDNQSWYFSNKVQEVAQESFQPWDFALSGGVRYQVARHWNVGLSGNYGLLNQANATNGYRIFNRNAVLSVGYSF